MDRLAIRAHHLLCSSLFSGHGYSEGFAGAMEKVVTRLHDGSNHEVALLDHPDLICAHCPRLSVNQAGRTEGEEERKAAAPEGETAAVPSEEVCAAAVCVADHNSVVRMDREVLHTLGVTKERGYSYRTLLLTAMDRLGPEDFDRICGGCTWQRQGLCSYESLMRRMHEIEQNIRESEV